MVNQQYLEAIMDGRLRIDVQTQKMDDGRTKATYSDVNGRIIEHMHMDAAEAGRRCVDKVKLGILQGELQIQR